MSGAIPDGSGDGAISRALDWLLGSQWHQKVQSTCGYLQLLVQGIAGGTLFTTEQVNSMGLPWLSKHWISIVGGSMLLNGALSFISKRMTASR